MAAWRLSPVTPRKRVKSNIRYSISSRFWQYSWSHISRIIYHLHYSGPPYSTTVAKHIVWNDELCACMVWVISVSKVSVPSYVRKSFTSWLVQSWAVFWAQFLYRYSLSYSWLIYWIWYKAWSLFISICWWHQNVWASINHLNHSICNADFPAAWMMLQIGCIATSYNLMRQRQRWSGVQLSA